MWIKRKIKRLMQSLHWRYANDGKGAVYLRQYDSACKIMDELAADGKRQDAKIAKFIKGYEIMLRTKAQFYSKGRYLPSGYVKKKYDLKVFTGFIEQFREEETCLNISGLKFEVPPGPLEDVWGHLSYDVFFQHILNFTLNDIQTINYSLYIACPEGPYEYQQVYLEPGDIVIDAGAFGGDFSILAAFKGCYAHAFEASPVIIEQYLKPNVALNSGLGGEIVTVPFALSDAKKEIIFNTYTDDLTASNLLTDQSNNSKRNGKKDKQVLSETVSAIDLDSYVHENNLDGVDFIKADIEGAERDMLKGAKEVLRDFAPKLALCTYHLPDDPEVMKDLILSANPSYVIDQKFAKLYAHVPGRTQQHGRLQPRKGVGCN